ncbi:MAG TPA: HAD-IA family hydrolase [Acidimicrobiales bacterium]|nr:HAD-IA family hydrolase [Acidimicrobiales bacterium]
MSPTSAGGAAPARLEAVVFDVDGTLVDSERHGHRVAFNLAFEEFGLPYRWDEEEYGQLLRTTGGRRRIEQYLARHGVGEAERADLAAELHDRKTAVMKELIAEGRVQARPGATRLLGELAGAGVALAVATTGSRGWVGNVLEKCAPGVEFAVTVAGDEVSARKPDPEAFSRAVELLGVAPASVVAVEDSAEGLESATGAGLRCAVVVNAYTADHDLGAADLVLDGFGEPGRPATVVADRRDTGCTGVLDHATLARLLR